MMTSGSESSPARAGRSSRWVMIALVMVLFLAGAAASYYGIQYYPAQTSTPTEHPLPPDPVVRLDLPHEEVEIPPGPHRERFQINCTICHSPRLVLTQPKLPEKKWEEVVHKMVATYGAPISSEEEREIVTYLSAVHGPTGP